jgi:hypothetical protein
VSRAWAPCPTDLLEIRINPDTGERLPGAYHLGIIDLAVLFYGSKSGI